jgi:DNA-binding IclR family transcriptional regulator
LSSPQSVARVIQILELLAASVRPMSLADLSRELAAPKSSIAALLRGLAHAEMVTAVEGAYQLGPGAFGLGSAMLEARRRLQSSDLVRAGMRRLAERSGETVLFAVSEPGTDTLTYVDIIESRNTVRFAMSIGDRRPLYCTSGGRMLLATLTPEELRRYLSRLKPQRLTEQTEVSKQQLAKAIATAHRAGFAQTRNQTADGVIGTAAAIRDAAGNVIGALVVAAPDARFRDRSASLAGLVMEEAVAISRNLGYRTPKRH